MAYDMTQRALESLRTDTSGPDEPEFFHLTFTRPELEYLYDILRDEYEANSDIPEIMQMFCRVSNALYGIN